MKKISFTFIFVISLFSLSCMGQKSGSASGSKSSSAKEIKTHGTLNNKTGLDGCGWVIKLNKKDLHDHEYIEPVNLDKFNPDYSLGICSENQKANKS